MAEPAPPGFAPQLANPFLDASTQPALTFQGARACVPTCAGAAAQRSDCPAEHNLAQGYQFGGGGTIGPSAGSSALHGAACGDPETGAAPLTHATRRLCAAARRQLPRAGATAVGAAAQRLPGPAQHARTLGRHTVQRKLLFRQVILALFRRGHR